MKIYFFGTPEFAVPMLEKLIENPDFEILGVVTQPDKKIGRKKTLSISPVKKIAVKNGIPVFQPGNIHELAKQISKFQKCDFFLVIAFGMILNRQIIDFPQKGTINIHASLLPIYRGASPIQSCILHGDSETGISIMKITEKMDQGPIYLLKRIKVDHDDDYPRLSAKLSEMAAKILPQVLDDILHNNLPPIPQDNSRATYCQKITKKKGQINFAKQTAEQIINMMHAYHPWPGVYTNLKGTKIKIIEAGKEADENIYVPGEIKIEKQSIKIQTKKDLLILKKVQPEGKNIMDIGSFLNGYKQKLL